MQLVAANKLHVWTGLKPFVKCVLQKDDAQNAIIRNNLDMERTLGQLSY